MSAPAIDPWIDAAERLSREVRRNPYLSLLAAGGLGCLLAGGFARRHLPGLAKLGARAALASALPALASLVREATAPEA
jgi:hypothetical protein